MSAIVPENMEEVAMKIASAQVHGQHLETDAVIKQAVFDILQAEMDDALMGHYDDVAWDGHDLVVKEFTGKVVGRVSPQQDTFVDDFKKDAGALEERFADAAAKIAGGR